MSETTKKRNGVQWKRANLVGLSKDTKRILDTFNSDFAKAQSSGKVLREALNKEWAGHYPDGKDGKICRFNVLNGVVNHAWFDKESPIQEGEALFP
jgi:hypothetical protein